MFLDSDDWLEDDSLEALLNAQNEHPDCMICANQFWNVNIKDGQLFRSEGSWNMFPSSTFNMKEIAETYCFLRMPNLFRSACAKLFRAKFGVKFHESFKYAEDATFVIEYLVQSGGKAYYLSKLILDVLNREGSAQRKKYTHEVFDSIEASAKKIIDLVNDEVAKMFMRMSGAYYTYFCFSAAVAENESRSEIKRIKSTLRLWVWDIIKCKQYPFDTRMRFFLAAFAPVPGYKAVISILDSRKPQQAGNAPEADMIPGWQDFPKAQANV